MGERGWWWLWISCPGLGVARIRALRAVAQAHQVTLADLWSWPLLRLQAALRWPDSLMVRVDSYRLSQGTTPSLWVPDNALFPLDQDWPISFDLLKRPPLAVHWSGRTQCWPFLSAQKAVAVVGTRRPSDHGCRMAYALGQCLARAGWPVVSGLAEGIDAASHHGCLAASGLPVGVLGTPLDRVYPPEHKALQAQVESAGLLLSEWPCGARVQRSNFALRNRLLVSVSCALVVVECPETSGSLLSAQIARTQNCPVWVVPGDALRWSCKGSNGLLQEGATPLLSPESLIASLGPGPLAAARSASMPLDRSRSSAERNPSLLRCVDEGLTLEQLSAALSCSPTQMAHELLQLELEGVIEPKPGLRWRSV